MEYSFDDIKNKHKNKACIIVSPGPNLAKFNYKKFNGKIICIGDSILRGRKFLMQTIGFVLTMNFLTQILNGI